MDIFTADQVGRTSGPTPAQRALRAPRGRSRDKSGHLMSSAGRSGARWGDRHHVRRGASRGGRTGEVRSDGDHPAVRPAQRAGEAGGGGRRGPPARGRLRGAGDGHRHQPPAGLRRQADALGAAAADPPHLRRDAEHGGDHRRGRGRAGARRLARPRRPDGRRDRAARGAHRQRGVGHQHGGDGRRPAARPGRPGRAVGVTRGRRRADPGAGGAHRGPDAGDDRCVRSGPPAGARAAVDLAEDRRAVPGRLRDRGAVCRCAG